MFHQIATLIISSSTPEHLFAPYAEHGCAGTKMPRRQHWKQTQFLTTESGMADGEVGTRPGEPRSFTAQHDITWHLIKASLCGLAHKVLTLCLVVV